jgi:hypothetical protein
MSRWSLLLGTTAAIFIASASTGCKNGGGANNYGFFIPAVNVVAITSVIPNEGSILGSTAITIIGSNIAIGGTQATIGGTSLIDVATPNTFTLTGVIPAGNYAAGSVNVSIMTSSQTVTLKNGYTFAQMAFASITPNNGPISGNVAVTIVGVNFVNVFPDGVVLQGVGATAGNTANLENVVVSFDGTTINAIVPGGLPLGSYNLIITSTSFGVLNAGPVYTVGSGLSTTMLITNIQSQASAAAPFVSPAVGPLTGGTTVQLTASLQPPATGFIPTNGINVNLIFPDGNTLPCTNVVVSSSTPSTPNDTCTFTTPDVATSAEGTLFFGGPVTIKVTSSTQGFALANSGFTFLPTSQNPIINTISPAQGPQGGGTPVTIEGVNFQSGSKSNVRAILVGGSPLLGLAIQSQNQLQGFTPPGTAGFQPVTIIGANGATSQTVSFDYRPSVVLSKITPNQSGTDGIAVTINGANFTTATIISGSITIGGNPVSDLTVINSSTVTGFAPANAQFGPEDVTVAPNGGLLGMTLKLAFTYGPSLNDPGAVGAASGVSIAPQGVGRALTLGNDFCATANGTHNTFSALSLPPRNLLGTTTTNTANPIDIKIASMEALNPAQDQDVIVLCDPAPGTGTPGNQVVEVYHNAGGGVFSLLNSNPVTGLPGGFGGTPTLAAVAIDVADMNQDGHPDVAVLGSSTVAGTPNGVALFYGSATGTLSPNNPVLDTATGDVVPGTPTFFPLGAGDLGAVQLKIVGVAGELADPFSGTPPPDATGSGFPDIIVISEVSATLSVLAGDGLGGFALVPTGSVAIGTPNPVGFDAADLTQSGVLDVCVACLGPSAGNGSFEVMLGDGAGAFQAAGNYTVPNVGGGGSNTVNFSSLVIGDVNFDCRPDVVVSNFDGNQVCVFLGNGDGSFSSPAEYPTETTTALDHTSNVVAIAGHSQSNGLNYIVCLDDQTAAGTSTFVTVVTRYELNLYIGNFEPEPPNPIFSTTTQGIQPQSISFGDINGDGLLDFVLVNRASSTVQVFIGDGQGNFSQPFSPIPLNANTNPESCVISRVDLTSPFPAVLVACEASNQIALMRNFGDGSLGSPIYINIDGTGPHQIIVEDMNGDGKPDIVTVNQASNNLSILLGDGTGSFTRAASSPYPVGTGPVAMCMTNPRVDPIFFIATANELDDDVSVLVVSGQTPTDVTFTSQGPFGLGANASFIVAASLVKPSPTTPIPPVAGPDAVAPVSIAVGDLNGDGIPDLVTANSFTHQVTVLHGKAQATLTLQGGGATFAVGDYLYGPPVGIGAGSTNVTPTFSGPGVPTANYFCQVVGVAGAPTVYQVADFQGGGSIEGGEGITGAPAAGTTGGPNLLPNASVTPVPDAFFIGDKLTDFNNGATAAVAGLSNFSPSGHFFQPTDYLSIDGTAINIGSPSVIIPIGTDPRIVKLFDVNFDGFLDIVVGDQNGGSVFTLINQAQANTSPVIPPIFSTGGHFNMPGLLQTFKNTPQYYVFQDEPQSTASTSGPGLVVCPAGEFTLDAADTVFYGLNPFPALPHLGYPIDINSVPPIGGDGPAEFGQTAGGLVLGLDIGHVTLDCPPSIGVVTDANTVTVFKLQ